MSAFRRFSWSYGLFTSGVLVGVWLSVPGTPVSAGIVGIVVGVFTIVALVRRWDA